MLIFSANARRLIDRAVAAFVEPPRAAIWQKWAEGNPGIRGPGDPWDDGGDPLPRDVVETALLALDRMEGDIERRKTAPNLSEDELSDLDNDLSQLHAVQRFLIRGRTLWAQKARAS